MQVGPDTVPVALEYAEGAGSVASAVAVLANRTAADPSGRGVPRPAAGLMVAAAVLAALLWRVMTSGVDIGGGMVPLVGPFAIAGLLVGAVRGTSRRASPPRSSVRMVTAPRILVLFVIAAVAEIGGAWLIWQSVREHRPWWLAVGGMLALAAYGFIATAQPDAHFGRVLAAYGGVFVAGSLAWGVVVDGFSPSRWDVVGAAICLLGVGVIMLAPRH